MIDEINSNFMWKMKNQNINFDATKWARGKATMEWDMGYFDGEKLPLHGRVNEGNIIQYIEKKTLKWFGLLHRSKSKHASRCIFDQTITRGASQLVTSRNAIPRYPKGNVWKCFLYKILSNIQNRMSLTMQISHNRTPLQAIMILIAIVDMLIRSAVVY